MAWKVKKEFDPEEFRRVWMSPEFGLQDVQKHFDSASSTLYKAARSMGLPIPRPKPPPKHTIDSAEDLEENCPSHEEICLATAIIRRGWSEEEEGRRRVGPGSRWRPQMTSII